MVLKGQVHTKAETPWRKKNEADTEQDTEMNETSEKEKIRKRWTPWILQLEFLPVLVRTRGSK